jgi:hypothetical protein
MVAPGVVASLHTDAQVNDHMPRVWVNIRPTLPFNKQRFVVECEKIVLFGKVHQYRKKNTYYCM